MDRFLFGLASIFLKSGRTVKNAVVVSPASRLFTSTSHGKAPGPKGPRRKLIDAIVEMKRRNPRFGCPRIAEQINKAFGLAIDKDVVRRVLAKHYKPGPPGGGPSWLTLLGHTKDSLWSIDL